MIKLFEGIKGKKWVVIAAAAAVGLILLSYRVSSPSEARKDESSQYYEVSFYTESLEKRVADLCRASEGIRNVSVLLTLDSGSEYVYAVNKEEKSEGGGSSGSREYLIVTRDGSSSPVQVTEIYPKVRGVAVVCTGGDRADVKMRLTELLSAALGIPTNRIKISS